MGSDTRKGNVYKTFNLKMFRKKIEKTRNEQNDKCSFGNRTAVFLQKKTLRLPVHTCLLGATSQDWKLTSCFGFGQLPDKSGGFVRPPAAHFGAKNNQSDAAVPTVKLRVSGLLAPPCRGQGCAIDVGATRVESPIPTNWRHYGGVHGKLGAMESRATRPPRLQSSDCPTGQALPDPCPGL